MYSYVAIDKKYVFGKLEKGEFLLMCDFKGLKILEVNDLTVNQINYYINSGDTVFYSRTEVSA